MNKIDRNLLLTLDKDKLIYIIDLFLDELESDNYSLYTTDSDYNTLLRKLIEENKDI